MTARRVEIAEPPEVTWQRLQSAFASLGKVEEANPTTRYLVGRARYGLNPVRLRISVLSGAEGTSVLDIQARGQDVWGVSSRKMIDTLLATI